MRIFLSLLLVLVLLVACKNDKTAEAELETTEVEIKQPVEIPVPDGQERFVGDFYCEMKDSIAVLTTQKAIYAVRFDDMALKLHETSKALKKEEYDQVQVTIHGTTEDNPLKIKNGYGFDQMITIKKIIEVSPAANNNVIRVGSPNSSK